MGVDQKGFITIPEFRGFQPAFSNIIDNTVNVLRSIDNDLIHSIYVSGSIAEGCAQETVSDLDLMVVCNREPDDIELMRQDTVRSKLEEQYSVVSQIDFEICSLQKVLNPDNLHNWGYLLKHHCVCVYGEDLRTRFEPFQPSRAIAAAVNRDFMLILNNAISLMSSLSRQYEVLRLQRVASRKIVRATSILRQDNDKDWPDTLEEHAKKFNVRYPALEEEMDYWLAMSHEPSGEIASYTQRLKTFIYWLNAEFHSR